MLRRTKSVAVIVGLASIALLSVVIAACGGDDDSSGGKDVQTVTLRLDYTPAGHHVPFFYGKDQGFFEDEGIDLKILPGQGSSATAQTVSTGEDQFGWVSLAVVPLAEEGKIKAVAGIIRKGGFGLLVSEDSGISSFSDLSGKTVVASRVGTQYPLIQAAVNKEGIQDLNIQNAGVNAEAIYAGGQGDAVGTLPWYAEPFVDPKRASNPLIFWDIGLHVMDYGIITSDKLIDSDPDLARRFVAATVKSWDEAEANTDDAIAAFTTANPGVTEEVTNKQFQGALDFIDTPNTSGQQTGYMSPQDWDAQLKVEKAYLDCECTDPSQYYTNKFVPK